MASERNQFVLLVTPSWISGLIGVVASLGVVATTVFLLYYNGSSLQFLQQSQTSTATRPLNDNYQTLDTKFSASVLVSDIPLFIFWAGVGVVAYSFVTNLTGVFREIEEIREELNYVHSDRRKLIREVALHLVIRVAVLIVWFFYIKFSLHVVLSYALALTAAGVSDAPISLGYLVAALAVLFLCSHLHAILLRLLLLRPRITASYL